ncbi:MAG: hypothetical protein N4A33_13360 [Bacteriovoracaceae bacterium]|jgi:hypothetical protein|nr:hypothetical protein [Bacteriovoracaceae bacterium]
MKWYIAAYSLMTIALAQTIEVDQSHTPIIQKFTRHLSQNFSKLTKQEFDILEQINKNLSTFSLKNTNDILEDSIYTKILENTVFGNESSRVSSIFIKKVEEKLKSNKLSYSSFSKQIIESIIADYKPFFEEGFINRYESYNRNNKNEVIKYKKIRMLTKYTSTTLTQFLASTAQDFNKKITKLCLETLKLINTKSYFLKNHSFYSLEIKQKQVFIFKKPKKEDKKIIQEKKDTLLDAIKSIDKNESEKMSEKIDQIIPKNE